MKFFPTAGKCILGSWNYGGLCKYLDKRSGVIAAVAAGIYWTCFESLHGLQS